MKHSVTLIALALALLACNALAPKPKAEWDTSPEALTVEASVTGGLAPTNFTENYIPDARLWGDGRLVWVEQTSGGRRVLEAHLTTQEMTDLINSFASKGFFGLKDFYEPKVMVMDGANTTLTVNLSSLSKSVTISTGADAPKAFSELFALVSGGAGATGADFTPTTGYLKVYPTGNGAGQESYHWPKESLGFGLDEVGAGKYVDGEALAFAWQIVNEGYYTAVESGGKSY